MSQRRLLLLGFLGAAVVALATGCQQRELSDAEATGLLEWLSCEECNDDELSYVTDTLGSRARGPLREALLELPAAYLDRGRQALRTSWSRRPPGAVDSAAYFDHYMSNYEATLQRRAAVGLAALGDTASLREAMERVGAIGYRPDVVNVIEGALRGLDAPGYSIAAGETIFLRPTAATVDVGDSVSLVATTRDGSGNPVGGSIGWTSSDPGVATASASVDRGRGVVTGVAPGTAVVTATFESVSADATVTVRPTPAPGPNLEIVSGDGQVDTAGTLLDAHLVVRVTDATGTEVAGATVAWVVTRGAPSRSSVTALTDAAGEAAYRPTLGSTPGIMWVEARAVGQRVRFRIRVRSP